MGSFRCYFGKYWFPKKNRSSFVRWLRNEECKKILGKHITHVEETALSHFWEKKLFSLISMLEFADNQSNIVPFIITILCFPFLVLIFLPGRYDVLHSWVSLRALFLSQCWFLKPFIFILSLLYCLSICNVLAFHLF